MTIGIVVSEADSASVHLGDHLRDLADWDGGDGGARTDGFELRRFADLHLDLDGVADAFDADLDFLVFASRHSGETGPLLTAHFTGNFGAAEFGGRDRELAEACPAAAARVLDALARHAPDGYEVGMECTHHGPTDVGVPSMFVELGSGEEQWADADAARAVARAVLDLAGAPARRERTVVAFGGGHYAPRPTRIARETDWAVGHVAADWSLDELGHPRRHRDVVAQVFERSGAEVAVVEGDRPTLEAVVDELGYAVRSETWIRETDGVPLAFVDAVEDALSTVEDGLRFGGPARGFDGDAFAVYPLPEALWNEAHGVDPGAALDAVDATALAYETAEDGNRAVGRVAVEDGDAHASLVERLVALVREDADRVERRDGTVVVRTAAFDPEKAATLGVPEGPKFGRLASGRSVTVDGEEIPPDAVRSERTRELPVPGRERVRHVSDTEGKGN